MVKLFEKLLGGKEMKDAEVDELKTDKTLIDETPKKEDIRVNGKIIKVSPSGYGFISSRDVPFERIFFHWTSLRHDTVKFVNLRNGMKVSFVVFDVEGRGYRAIKIKVEEE